MKLVDVFKSPRKPDTYLYLEKGQDLEALPEGLRQVFGEPQHVLSLKLTPDRQLARYTGQEVLEGLEDKGFFLQMPPRDGEVDTVC